MCKSRNRSWAMMTALPVTISTVDSDLVCSSCNSSSNSSSMCVSVLFVLLVTKNSIRREFVCVFMCKYCCSWLRVADVAVVVAAVVALAPHRVGTVSVPLLPAVGAEGLLGQRLTAPVTTKIS